MHSPRSILVVMDPPRQPQTALARAARLAAETGARLHLAAFVHHPMYELPEVFETHQRRSVRRSLEQTRGAWLLDQVRDAGLLAAAVDTEVIWSEAIHEWIVEACAAERFDLVLKTAHRSRTLLHMPTDWHLLRDCPAPVWLATGRPGAARAAERGDAAAGPDGTAVPAPTVLATLDPTRTDAVHTTLNHRVLEVAAARAAARNAELHVAWCMRLPDLLGDLDPVQPDQYGAKILRTMLPRLRSLVEPWQIPDNRIHLPFGAPGAALAGLARQISAELIVVGNSTRRGPAALMRHSAAERVLEKARCDVLAVRA